MFVLSRITWRVGTDALRVCGTCARAFGHPVGADATDRSAFANGFPLHRITWGPPIADNGASAIRRPQRSGATIDRNIRRAVAPSTRIKHAAAERRSNFMSD
ncbi:hypothetical protein [Rhizorhabdus argentea]|uniref:hypothetical protein n=1 Tax=Rhizorhabdus argentea TaxID=1387174 RepID=UPI0030ECCA74